MRRRLENRYNVFNLVNVDDRSLSSVPIAFYETSTNQYASDPKEPGWRRSVLSQADFCDASSILRLLYSFSLRFRELQVPPAE